MKKLKYLLLFLVIFGFKNINANNVPDEGMWLPMFFKDLNYADMKKMGLRLTAEQLYDINHSSLKDAIVNFGGFCTGEIVSNEGLVFTNHHCGYSSIQEHSTIEHDYLANGFWAYSKEEELPCPNLTVSFLIRMEDVTKIVLEGISSQTSEQERSKAIREAIEKLKKENSEKGRYTVEVKSFFEGNEYYLFVSEVYKDVRLAGAPPSSIGKFGGDTDNWMWPRHTGDFSIFRIYMSPDGKPAKYSKENVPFKPKHFLPVSLKGVKKNDFAMIWGYPGSTERYMTSFEINKTLTVENPAIIESGENLLPVMKKYMDADPKINIMYATNYAQLMNLWKNKIGETRGLKRLNVADQKKEIEYQFGAWVYKDDARKEKYGTVLQSLDSATQSLINQKSDRITWLFQMSFAACNTLGYVLGENFKMAGLFSGEKDPESRLMAPFLEETKKHFAETDVVTEKAIFKAMIEMFAKEPVEFQPAFMQKIQKDYKGNIDKFVDEAFTKSIFASLKNFENFAKKPKKKNFDNDLLKEVSMDIYNLFLKSSNSSKKASSDLKIARRSFVEGIREMNPKWVRYPDANFTLRMTYGKILDYYPADGVHYNYLTTLKGVMEKEDPKNEEFIVPAKLKQLFETKNYGRYAENGEIVTCFLTNNDITGGNSGSPCINGDGHLIGIAFDGNWEAMSGDIAFEPELQRTINVDIRYVLFVIDKMANAQNLIKELQIVE